MKTIMHLVIIIILSISTIRASEEKLGAEFVIYEDYSIKKSNINVTIRSEEDIYGIQFYIRG